MKRFIFIFSALLILLQLSAQEKRLALVCGNSAYKNGGFLKNPVNDANLMAATLRSLGFDVILKTNSDLKSMQNTLVEFGNRLKGYDVALFYYAGHGIQVDGDNYLIPVDARLEEKSLCQFEALNVDAITKTLVSGNVRLSIIILDACRNNPFKTWMRGYSRGFKPVSNQAAGSIIAFATRENEAASDGPGKYGLYTEKLVQQMETAQNITEVFQNTRIEVLKASNNQQCPQEWNMLTGNFYFNQTGKPTENVVNETINANLISGTVVSNYGMIEIDSEIGGTLFLEFDTSEVYSAVPQQII
ncbi:MAG: caspase family protein [Bacteroidales bacterium]